MLTKNEPLTELLHCLFVYPLSVHLSKKRNLFIRVELRKDDADLKKAALDVRDCSHAELADFPHLSADA